MPARSSPGMSSSADVVLRKCGVKFAPLSLVLLYDDRRAAKTRKHVLKLTRHLSKQSVLPEVAAALRLLPAHSRLLQAMSEAQLERLLCIARDHLCGLSLTQSLEKAARLDQIDSAEDLNTVDEETLARKKAVMEEAFELNRSRPGDIDFVYDKEVDFGGDGNEDGAAPDDLNIEACDWDSDTEEMF